MDVKEVTPLEALEIAKAKNQGSYKYSLISRGKSSFRGGVG